MKKIIFVLVAVFLVFSSIRIFSTNVLPGKKITFIGKSVLGDWGIFCKIDGDLAREIIVPPNSFKIDIAFNDKVVFYTQKPSSKFTVVRDGVVVELSANLGSPVWIEKFVWGDEKYQGYIRFVDGDDPCYKAR